MNQERQDENDAPNTGYPQEGQMPFHMGIGLEKPSQTHAKE